MTPCRSSGEDYATRRRRELERDINTRAFVGWATKEEIAARRADMEHNILEEVRTAPPRCSTGPATGTPRPSNPTFVGSINYRRAFSHNVQGAVPPSFDPLSIPAIAEAHRVAVQFCEQYRMLRTQVEILQEENTRLRRMLQRLLTSIIVVPPSPQRE